MLEAVAVTVAELTVKKLLPLETALTNAALGNRVHEVFTSCGGRACERTVRDDIRELLGGPVGQMPDQLREIADCPLKVKQRGANTYSVLAIGDDKLRGRLLRRIRTLIALFARLTRRVNCVSSSACPASPCGASRLTASSLERRVGRALEWAIGHAEGRRNNVGNWLAWRCSRLGLDQHDVESVMEQYQQEVCGLGDHRYPRSEAMATVRSVFRRAAAIA